VTVDDRAASLMNNMIASFDSAYADLDEKRRVRQFRQVNAK